MSILLAKIEKAWNKKSGAIVQEDGTPIGVWKIVGVVDNEGTERIAITIEIPDVEARVEVPIATSAASEPATSTPATSVSVLFKDTFAPTDIDAILDSLPPVPKSPKREVPSSKPFVPSRERPSQEELEGLEATALAEKSKVLQSDISSLRDRLKGLKH